MNRVAKLVNDNKELVKELAIKDVKIAEMKDNLVKIDEDNKLIKDQNFYLLDEIECKKHAVDLLEMKLTDVEDDLNKSNSRIKVLEERNSILTKTKKNQLDDLALSKKNEKNLNEIISDLSEKNLKMLKEKQEIDDKLDSFEIMINNYKMELNNKTNEISKLKRYNMDLNNDIVRIKTDLNELDDKYQHLANSKYNLEQENYYLKNSNRDLNIKLEKMLNSNRDLNIQLERWLNSNSFRYTSILRKLKSFISKS